ncbi:MAG: hypothetical protein V1704_02355 [Candidatus Vogelbacteria bacterium]
MATPKLVVGGTSVTASQLSEMFRQFGTGELNGEHTQALIEHRDPFKIDMSRGGQLMSWCRLFKDLFGLEIDPTTVSIPEPKDGFGRLIVVPQGLMLNQILGVCRKRFDNVYSVYNNLDQQVTVNDRTSVQTYAIWIRNRVEADEEFSNFSADQLKEKDVLGVTLMERLLLELKYHSETGEHLDIENITLCSGSRDSDGNVPDVNWNRDNRKLYVNSHNPRNRNANLRARQEVSRNKESIVGSFCV